MKLQNAMVLMTGLRNEGNSMSRPLFMHEIPFEKFFHGHKKTGVHQLECEFAVVSTGSQHLRMGPNFEGAHFLQSGLTWSKC